MKRPNIKDFFAEKTDLEAVHSEYTKSPHLYSYSSALDRYIDYLEEKLTPKKGDIEIRKEKFMDKIAVFLNEYGREMLREFYDYWTEHGENDRKFRAEKEKSFNIGLRLKRWARNYKPNKTNNQQERIKQNSKGW